MLVLGVTDGMTCGAALVNDGVVVAAVHEERLCRLKMAYGFPRGSLAEVMRLAGVSYRDIDLVTVATENNHFFNGVRPFDGWLAKDKGLMRNAVFTTAGAFGTLVDRVPLLEELYYRTRWPVFAARRRAIKRILQREFRLTAPVEFIDHHLAHATSAYFTSGYDEAVVVTMDGGGDGASSHVYTVRDGVFERTGFTSAYNSVGNYYAYITHICGYKAQKHEGKITGLAAHGQPAYRQLLDSFITIDDGQLRNVGGVVFGAAVRALKKCLPPDFSNEDLSASIQQHSEDLAVAYVRHHLRTGSPRNLAIAGGLFANVRINQEVHEIDGVDRIFIHPGMTDCGLAVGAALAPCIRNRRGPTMKRADGMIRDVYYGPEYSEAEIERALQSAGCTYWKSERLAAEVAQLLADGYVVARFDGRMEYGPRALGNRSILYQPADASVNDWLNARLHRTEFMPFAPSTLIEDAQAYYENYAGARDAARFMTITFDCTKLMKATCPGVVHVDGTARPQLVERGASPAYYEIIEEFRRVTGVSTIINTSFNMHEEPIVCSPADAVRAFQLGHLDYLAIGNFVVPSPEPIDRPVRPMSRMVAVASRE